MAASDRDGRHRRRRLRWCRDPIEALPIAAFSMMRRICRPATARTGRPPGRSTRTATALCSAKAGALICSSRRRTPKPVAPAVGGAGCRYHLGRLSYGGARGVMSVRAGRAMTRSGWRVVAGGHRPRQRARHGDALSAPRRPTPSASPVVIEPRCTRRSLRWATRSARSVRSVGARGVDCATASSADPQTRDTTIPRLTLTSSPANRAMAITATINDSFRFGGHNVALAFRRY